MRHESVVGIPVWVSRVMLALLAFAVLAISVAPAQAALVVASSDNNKVMRYNSVTGAFIEVLASGAALGNPVAPIVGPDGDFYVSSLINSQVLRFDGTTGAPKGVFASGGGLFWATGIRFRLSHLQSH